MPLFNYSRIGCDKIVYDGARLSDVFEIRDFATSALPTIEANTQQVGNRSGVYFVSRKIRTRLITLTLGLDAGSRCPIDIFFEFLSQNNLIAKDGPKKLELDGRGYFMAMLVGETQIEQKGTKGVIACEFTCFDPFFYGKEHTVELAAGSNAFTLQGSQPAFPVIELTGCKEAFTLQDEDTHDMVRIPDVVDTAKLMIDMENCRCLANGYYKPADITVTDFWPLHSGENRLNISSGHGTLTYRERYL